MLGVRVIHRNNRILQHAFFRHRAEADDASCGLFGSANHTRQRIGPLGVQNTDQVRAIIHRDVRLVIERGKNVAVISVIVLAFNGKNCDAVIAHQRSRNVILRRKRIRRA